MMFLLKRRRDDHYNLISSFTELQKFTTFALSPVHTNPGTFETFFYTNRWFLCSHETSESVHSSAAFWCGQGLIIAIQFLVLVFVLVLESRGL